jgi:lipopolysaccharide export system protein LptA
VRKSLALILSPILLAVFVAAGFAAEIKGKPDRNEGQGTLPIEITADRLSADNAKNSVTFEGAVHAKQGDVTLNADRLFAEYSKSAGAIEKIVADGNVLMSQPGRTATGARAVFYNLEQRIVLSGNTVLTQDKNVLKGETLTIYLKENRSVVDGPVHAVIYPEKGLELKGIPGK